MSSNFNISNESVSSNNLNSIELSQLLPEPIIEIDHSGKIVFINNTGKNKFELNDDDISNGISIFSLINQNDINKCLECFGKLKEKIENIKVECSFVSKSGNMFPAIFNIAPIIANDNKQLGFLGIVQDISLLKKVEQDLRKLNNNLERRIREKTIQMESALTELKTEVNIRKRMSQNLQSAKEELSKAFLQEQDISEMKSRFISMITHEFRTPLTIILSSAYMMEQFYRTGNEKKLLKHLEKIRISSSNLSQLIERTITLSKSEAGVIKTVPELFDLIDFMNNMMREIALFDKNKHKVSFDTDSKSIEVFTDPNLLITVFNNIISNALKYTDEKKGVSISVKDGESYVLIEISDEGIGIPEEEIKRIFQPFHRCSNVGERYGSGLGLSIVIKFLEYLKSDISINSKPYSGTTVSINLLKSLT
jgi:PAS domain S-box-containing protein